MQEQHGDRERWRIGHYAQLRRRLDAIAERLTRDIDSHKRHVQRVE